MMSWKGSTIFLARSVASSSRSATEAGPGPRSRDDFESEQTIAETLQRSVLPALACPDRDRRRCCPARRSSMWRLGSTYGAAQGRVGLVVGDVVGKGVQAAGTMAQLERAARFRSFHRLKPASTLARLKSPRRRSAGNCVATVAYVVVDPEAGTCRYTSAGHPPPLVAYLDGAVEFLEGARGSPLGTVPDARYTQAVVEVPAGSDAAADHRACRNGEGVALDQGLEPLRTAVLDGLRIRAARRSRTRGDDRNRRTRRRHRDPGRRCLASRARILDLRLPSDVSSLNLVRDGLRIWVGGSPAQPNGSRGSRPGELGSSAPTRSSKRPAIRRVDVASRRARRSKGTNRHRGHRPAGPARRLIRPRAGAPADAFADVIRRDRSRQDGYSRDSRRKEITESREPSE